MSYKGNIRPSTEKNYNLSTPVNTTPGRASCCVVGVQSGRH